MEIAMAIVKSTEDELIIENESGLSIHTERLENGNISIKNNRGAGVTLSPEQAMSFANSLGSADFLFNQEDKKITPSNEIRPYSLLGTAESYPSVKEAMQDPRVKDSILKCFSEFVEKERNKKYVSAKKNVGEHISKCILEYPKVIVESHYQDDMDTMFEEFKEVDNIKLPFPKLTIITGENIEISYTPAEDERIARRSNIQSGSVNMFYCYFLSEHPHGIDVDIFLAREGDKSGTLYVATAVIMHDGTQLQFIVEDNGIAGNRENFYTYLRSAMSAIYMMTMGKNNFYMSVPTPEEAATNRKRISKGKKPLIEFKVATIEGKKTMVSSTPHGTHASPRLHWRRGHWRTMSKSGKKTWIAPMEVGDEENGRVIKTYAIGKYSLMEAR
jgi:hypothetical protein